jgi:hypothetical protein
MPVSKVKGRTDEFLGVNVTSEMRKELEEIAWQRRITLSDVIREAIEFHLILRKLNMLKFDSKKAIGILNKRKATFTQLAEELESVKRAIEIIVEAVKSKEE